MEAKQVDFLLSGIRNPLTDEPLAGGYVFTYRAGTSTPEALFVDRDTIGGHATNPVTLDAYGRAEVYGDGVYKFIIKTSDFVTLIEIDNLEYKATLSEAGLDPLDADLDFNSYRGVNLAPGNSAGHTVEYAQFTDATESLSEDITGLGNRLDNLKFTDLKDTPSTLTNQEEKVPVVNAEGTALELITSAALLATASFLNLSDTPVAYTGQTGKSVKVNAGETALEWGYPDARTLYGIAISSTPPDDGQVLAYNESIGVYEPVNQTSIPTLAKLKAGTGLSGADYDGSSPVTWSANGVSGVTLNDVAGTSYNAPPNKIILAAAAVSSNGIMGVFLIPKTDVNAGILSTQVSSGGSSYYYNTCTYTTGAGNSVVMGTSTTAITRTIVLLGDAG